MRRLIDANSLKHSMDKYNYSYFGANYEKILEVIDEEPTVAPPVKRGHWMTDDYEVSNTCSACGWVMLFRKPTNYCPHCGAKMDEEVMTE